MSPEELAAAAAAPARSAAAGWFAVLARCKLQRRFPGQEEALVEHMVQP